jgi:hypothetical protein
MNHVLHGKLVRIAIIGGLLIGPSVLTSGLTLLRAQDEVQDTRSVDDRATVGENRQDGFQQADAPRWSADADRPRLLSEPFENPRQLLRLFDIGDSQLESFTDGQPLGDDDQEALIRILYRLPQIDLASIHRWQTAAVPWPDLINTPSQLRTSYYLLRGRVRRIEKQTLSARLSELFEFDHYYRVSLESPDTDHAIVICVREIPAAWRDQPTIAERVRLSAMFLKVGSRSPTATELIFAAHRPAWLPDRINQPLGIGPSHVLLGDLDMDVGLFDFARQRNRLPIGSAERECFYELLSAAGRATTPQMVEVAEQGELASLLQDPGQWHGRAVTIRGSVRRVTRVLVEEADIRDRFGIDHYYQLDVLVPLGDQRIEFQNKQGKAEGPVYQNSFPFTFCVAQLPEPWLEFVGKDRMNERMATPGFFFKLWSYPSAYVAAYDTNQRQLSPMFVALQPGPPTEASTGDVTGGWMWGVGFLAVLAFLWFAVWRLQRSDRKFMREKVRRRFADDEPVSLDKLEP